MAVHSTPLRHEHWSSRFTFVLAAIGSAVGLGNFWRFPYTAGENGGGAFVIIYAVCVALVALPILMAELFIGRRGGTDAVDSVRQVAIGDARSSGWSVFAWISMTAAFLILTFYSVIAGWIIAYIPDAATGGLQGINAEASGEKFGALLADPWTMLACHTLFMGLTVTIVARGLHAGIETAVQILMPAFFIMLLGIVAFAAVAGDLAAAARFLFHVDFSKITGAVVLEAIGQAFFSIGVGTAIMLTYGAYLTEDAHIPRASVYIAFSDTMVAVLAGFAIFPIVFQFGLDPAGGPGLIFVTLPVAFGQMAFGQVFATVFFVLALFAALTSSISMLEIPVRRCIDHYNLPRVLSALLLGAVAWIIGLASVFSFNIWGGWHPFGFVEAFEGKTLFDMLDFLTSNIMLPLAGFLTAVFAGWVLSEAVAKEELRLSPRLHRAWRVLIRFVAPASVGSVLVYLAVVQVLSP